MKEVLRPAAEAPNVSRTRALEERGRVMDRAEEESRIDETCQELISLLRKNSSYEGGPGFRQPDTLAAIRSVGERLNRAADGTTYLMSKVASKVQATDPLAASWLNNAWNGIGFWQS